MWRSTIESDKRIKNSFYVLNSHELTARKTNSPLLRTNSPPANKLTGECGAGCHPAAGWLPACLAGADAVPSDEFERHMKSSVVHNRAYPNKARKTNT
ncbi:MAG: hypothetical protein JWO80_5311 [Bryobacterales bacterium]|nr:hypothetical protein [Bryobacterales bacterium]